MTTPTTTANDAVVELTSYELMTLFHVATTPEAQRTREAMRLPALEDGSPLLDAALASLVLRGLADDQDGRLVPAGALVGLVNVLGTATSWVEVVVTTEHVRQGALVVVSPHGHALLEARPSRVWQAVPLEAQVPVLATAAGYVAAGFESRPERPFGGVVTLIDGAGSRTTGVRVDPDGAWSVVRGSGETLSEPARVEPDPTFAFLAEAAA
ncbi:hypothetical protein AAG589_07270 [Isoptericola sp. F-RaC21]|uniref:hypothetical protein n=1 Tax=Isoptericola sp. F-RaC21 TaxID=3141452 RepID=UPI00315B5ADB